MSTDEVVASVAPRGFTKTRNLNLSLGVLKFLVYFRLKSSYFVLNFSVNDLWYILLV